MNRFFKLVKLGVSLILVLSFILSVASCQRNLREKYEYEQRLSDLLYEKQRLLNEKERITLEFMQTYDSASFMSLVFTGVDRALYEKILPIMSAQYVGDIELVGVMALSEDELPGFDGKITIGQYHDLVSRGWGTALYWDGDGQLGAFIERMNALFDSVGIEPADSVVFASGVYHESHDAILTAYGIDNAVYYESDEIKCIEKSRPEGVWHPGYMGWRCVGPSRKCKDAIEADYGYALFEIGFDNSVGKGETSFFPVIGDESETEEARTDTFIRMVEAFKQSITEGKIAVNNIGFVRDYMQSYHEWLDASAAQHVADLERLEAEIAAVQKQITDLYNQYH